MTIKRLFGTFGVRRIANQELTPEFASKLAAAYGTLVKRTVAVGGDPRTSTEMIKHSVIAGLLSSGCKVIDLGILPTPAVQFAVRNYYDGGIMITASHNSKELNGFKPMLKDATPLTKEQILELKDIIFKNNFPVSGAKGEVTKKDLTDDYVKTVRDSIKEKFKPLKIVMDAGNGMAGLYIEKVFSNLGIEVIPIFTELDGSFPNHETNPKIPENRTKLVEKIISEKADLGFMFDGDADRMCVLDRKGELVDYGLVMAIISEYLVKNSSKKKVIHEVRTSRVVRDWIEKIGGIIEITECWTIPIKLKMKADSEVVFGGETSGHFMFRQTHESDDGIFAALTFLQAISAKDESFDEILKKFKEKYFVLEEKNFEMADMEEADKILERLKNKYLTEGAQILEIDGLSVVYPNWWFNLRKSQSEPIIRLNMETDSKKLFDEKKAELIGLIEQQ